MSKTRQVEKTLHKQGADEGRATDAELIRGIRLILWGRQRAGRWVLSPEAEWSPEGRATDAQLIRGIRLILWGRKVEAVADLLIRNGRGPVEGEEP